MHVSGCILLCVHVNTCTCTFNHLHTFLHSMYVCVHVCTCAQCSIGGARLPALLLLHALLRSWWRQRQGGFLFLGNMLHVSV